MIKREAEGVQWLEFELFQSFAKVKHAVFLRHGGVSCEPYFSLNLGEFVEDDPEGVSENRKRACSAAGFSSLIFPKLEHGKNVLEAEGFKHCACDALTTQAPDVGLAVTHADCQAALFYDPVQHAAACVHAGWRGSVHNIYAETAAFMKRKYGSNPADLHAAISPSLGPNKAEFVHYQKELPEQFWEYRTKENHFDFWQISRMQLENCGLLSHHIQVAGICTYENADLCFSYRRDKITGRHASAISLG